MKPVPMPTDPDLDIMNFQVFHSLAIFPVPNTLGIIIHQSEYSELRVSRIKLITDMMFPS